MFCFLFLCGVYNVDGSLQMADSGFQCMCGRAFLTMAALQSHVDTKHASPQPFLQRPARQDDHQAGGSDRQKRERTRGRKRRLGRSSDWGSQRPGRAVSTRREWSPIRHCSSSPPHRPRMETSCTGDIRDRLRHMALPHSTEELALVRGVEGDQLHGQPMSPGGQGASAGEPMLDDRAPLETEEPLPEDELGLEPEIVLSPIPGPEEVTVGGQETEDGEAEVAVATATKEASTMTDGDLPYVEVRLVDSGVRIVTSHTPIFGCHCGHQCGSD